MKCMYNFLVFILLFTSVFVYCKPAGFDLDAYGFQLKQLIEEEKKSLKNMGLPEEVYEKDVILSKTSRYRSLLKEKFNFAAQVKIFGIDDMVPLPSVLEGENQRFKEYFNEYLSDQCNFIKGLTYREFEVPKDYDAQCNGVGDDMVTLSAVVKTVDPTSSVYLWQHHGGPDVSGSSIKKYHLISEEYSTFNQVFLDHRGTGAFNSFMSREFRIIEEYGKLNESNPSGFAKEVMSKIKENNQYISSHHQACDALYVNNIMTKEFNNKNQIKNPEFANKIDFIGHSYGAIVATKLNNILASLGNSYDNKKKVLKSIVYHSPTLLLSSEYEFYKSLISKEVIQNFITYALSYNAGEAELADKSSYRRQADDLFQLINNKFQSSGYTGKDIEKFCSIVTGQEESVFINELYNGRYDIFSLIYVQHTNDGLVLTNPKTPDSFTSIADVCFDRAYTKTYNAVRGALSLESMKPAIAPRKFKKKPSPFPKNIKDVSYLLLQFNNDRLIPTANVDAINQNLINSYRNNPHNREKAPNVTYHKYLNESIHCLETPRVISTINKFLNDSDEFETGTVEKSEIHRSSRSNTAYNQRAKLFLKTFGGSSIKKN